MLEQVVSVDTILIESLFFWTKQSALSLAGLKYTYDQWRAG